MLYINAKSMYTMLIEPENFFISCRQLINQYSWY